MLQYFDGYTAKHNIVIDSERYFYHTLVNTEHIVRVICTILIYVADPDPDWSQIQCMGSPDPDPGGQKWE